MAELIKFDLIVNSLADLVAGELESRGIKFAKDLTILETNKYPGKATIISPFYTRARTGSFEDFKENFLVPWAVELAIKLARPFDMTIYNQKLPVNTHEAFISLDSAVIVRGVTDYCIESKYEEFSDKILYRFDVVAGWNDR